MGIPRFRVSLAAPAAALALAVLVPPSGCSSRRAGESPYPRLEARRTLAVVSVTSEVQDEKWRDLRLGFGLAALITEQLHGTGRFALVEEKPEIRDRLRLTREQGWRAGTGTEPASLARTGGELGVQAVASGSVLSFASPRSRTFIGPLGMRSNRVEVVVRVCIQDLPLGRTFCDEGSGEATVEAQEAFFEYAGAGEVVFDRTTVGAATAEAVRAAVASLMGEGR